MRHRAESRRTNTVRSAQGYTYVATIMICSSESSSRIRFLTPTLASLWTTAPFVHSRRRKSRSSQIGPLGTRIFVVAWRQPPMQVWHAVAERLVVHLPCSNSTLHSRGESRHLQQVPTARPDLQLEEVGDALSSDVEDRTTVVLSRIELYVSVRKASDRVTVRSRLDLLDLRAVAAAHRCSLARTIASTLSRRAPAGGARGCSAGSRPSGHGGNGRYEPR